MLSWHFDELKELVFRQWSRNWRRVVMLKLHKTPQNHWVHCKDFLWYALKSSLNKSHPQLCSSWKIPGGFVKDMLDDLHSVNGYQFLCVNFLGGPWTVQAKSLPGQNLSTKAVEMVESLEGKVKIFQPCKIKAMLCVKCCQFCFCIWKDVIFHMCRWCSADTLSS